MYLKLNRTIKTMKKILFAAVLLFALVGAPVQAQFSLEYVPQFGMYLNQLCANGGPMYQSIKRRLDTIDTRKNIREQSVPIITRQEIQAFYREKEMIQQLERNALNNQFNHLQARNYIMSQRCQDAWKGLMRLGFAYAGLAGRLENFAAARPDAIR